MKNIFAFATPYAQTRREQVYVEAAATIDHAFKVLQVNEVPEAAEEHLKSVHRFMTYQYIHVNLPRQVGKTTSLLYHAAKNPHNTLLVVRNKMMLRHILTDPMYSNFGEVSIIDSSYMSDFATRGKKLDYEFYLLDELLPAQRNQVIEFLATSHVITKRHVKLLSVGTDN